MRPLARLSTPLLALCALLASAAPAVGQVDPGLPANPPGSVQVLPDGSLLAVSPAGSAAAGYDDPLSIQGGAARWIGGSDLLAMPGISLARAISDNGQFALGAAPAAASPGSVIAQVWNPGTGWIELPPPPGLVPGPHSDWPGWALSAEGTAVAGSYLDGPTEVFRAYRWSFASGPELLPHSNLMTRSGAFALSADGQVVGGSMGWLSPFTGDPLFRPCLWRADGSIEHLLPLAVTISGIPNDSLATVIDLDGDGTAAVGRSADGLPFLWREGQGLTWLPAPADGSGSAGQLVPLAVGEDGAFVIGEGPQHSGRWVWTPTSGTVDLLAVLEDLGADPAPGSSDPYSVRDVSLDGTVLVGSLTSGILNSDALVFQIPSLADLGGWTNVGGGLAAPFQPQPVLTGRGPQIAGAHTEVTLQSYPHSGLAYLVVGLSDLSAPFKGGLLVPHPDLLITHLYFGGAPWTVDFDWPAGVPSGASLWYQCWLTSNESLTGFVASNGLRSTTG